MAYMSEEGYKKLMAELKELETVERPKISAAIAQLRGEIISGRYSSFSGITIRLTSANRAPRNPLPGVRKDMASKMLVFPLPFSP